MGAAAVIAGILAQVEEFLDVDVPGFEIGADSALALAALIDGNSGVIGHLEEGHDALAFAIGALDMGAKAAHRGPVIAQTARVFGQQRVVLDRLEDAFEVIGHGGEKARAELGTQRARIEQGRRRGHEGKARQQVVKLDGAGFAVDFADGEAHGDAHEERLRQLEDVAFDMQEIAIIEGLQAQILELLVALGLDGGGDALEVEAGQLRIDQLGVDAGAQVMGEIFGVAGGHVGVGRLIGAAGDEAECLAAQLVEQQASRDQRVIGLGFNEGARGKDGGKRQLVERDAVIEVAAGFAENGLRGGALEAGAGLLDDGEQARFIDWDRGTIGQLHRQRQGWSYRGGMAGGAGAGALLAVEHIGAGDLLVLAAHQRQLDLVLHVLDVEHPAILGATRERGEHVIGQGFDDLVHPARGGGLVALDGEECLGERHGDLALVERHQRAIALEDGIARRGGGMNLQLRHRTQEPRRWWCGGLRRGRNLTNGQADACTRGTPRPWT